MMLSPVQGLPDAALTCCALTHSCLSDAGLRTLIMLLFAATTLRLILENFLKYGLRVSPKNWVLAVITPEGTCWLLHVCSMSVACL